MRLEIERALERPDVQVIPVLVDGARMPGENELPEGLRPLARRNACELSDSRWDYDVEVLCRRLRHVLGESRVEHEHRLSPPADSAHDGPTEPTAGILLPVVATLAAAACAAVAAALLSDPLAGARDAPLWSRLEEYAIERGMIWAIVGAVLAAAVAATFGRVRVPLGPAFVGAGAGWIAGAAGGAGHVAIRELIEHAEWLMRLVGIALPGMALAVVLARSAGARAGECALAALTGAVVGSLLGTEQIPGRTLRLTVHVVLVVGAIVAILAVPSHRSLYARHAVTSRRAAAR